MHRRDRRRSRAEAGAPERESPSVDQKAPKDCCEVLRDMSMEISPIVDALALGVALYSHWQRIRTIGVRKEILTK